MDQRQAIILISKVNDVNIFHFFALEVKAVWDFIENNRGYQCFLVIEHFDEGNCVQQWRRNVLKAILPTYVSIEDAKRTIVAKENYIKDTIQLQIDSWIIDPWTFKNYAPSPHYMDLATKVKSYYKTERKEGRHAVFVTRKKSRILHDMLTKVSLEDVFVKTCSTHSIPYKVVCFDNATFEEQAKALSEARVMLSCHGAGNTNVFLLPNNGHLVEINFRKHWNCDPVCDNHFHGVLPYTSKCDGKLTYRPYFHKADYHNMCKLFKKGYTEVQVEDASEYLDRNPINIKNVYVDAYKILNTVASIMKN
jgi:hypothetical protein